MSIKAVSERNHSLDLLRGLCILGVLFHHTCLYKGGSGLPYLVEQASFLLEVPALFFVSGLTYQYINRNMIISNFLKLSLVFTLVAFLIGLLTHSLCLQMILQPLFLNKLELPDTFSILSSSYWFVPMYALVLVFSTIVISKAQQLYPFVMLFFLFCYVADYFELIKFGKFLVFGWGMKRIAMHIIFFLFGYFVGERWVPSQFRNYFVFLLILTIIALLIFFYQDLGYSVFPLSERKNKGDFVYITISFLSIAGLFILYCYQIKNVLLEHIGQYSIFYFVGQGLSSSYIAYIVPYVQFNWFFKLLTVFAVNFAMMMIFSEVLRFIYEKIGRCYHRMLVYFLPSS